MNRKTVEHFKGCLLGGAVGDALGAPVEFMALEEIKDHFGPGGIDTFVRAYGKVGAITGNLLGALLGTTAIPEQYQAELELAPLIEEIAGDLFALVSNGR